MSKNFAHLKADCPVYDLFPGGCCPIRNVLVPGRAVMQGDNGDQPQDFYDVDLAALAPETRAALARRVAEKLGGTVAEVEAQMSERGLPLRAVHVQAVSTDSRAFL